MKGWSQAQTPWLGPQTSQDIAQMEMLIMRVLGWRLGCLTAASFVDQLLADALSGAHFHLQSQPADLLSTARQLAAKLLGYAMSGLPCLLYLPKRLRTVCLSAHKTLAFVSACAMHGITAAVFVPNSSLAQRCQCTFAACTYCCMQRCNQVLRCSCCGMKL